MGNNWPGTERRHKSFEYRKQTVLTVVWKVSVTGIILVIFATLGYAINYGHNLVTKQDLNDQVAPVKSDISQIQKDIAYIKGQIDEEKELRMQSQNQNQNRN